MPGRPHPTTTARVDVAGVTRRFGSGAQARTVLDGVDLRIRAGESVAVVGRSGSGKSTLLNLLAAIDRPTAGSVVVDGVAIGELDERRAARWRGLGVGIVFQFFQLLPTLTLAENVELPMELAGLGRPAARRRRAAELLEQVGLADHADRLPGETSGGQQQRAAVARALANDPPLLVADEPTGNLDAAAAAQVTSLLRAATAAGRTLVLVTHDAQLAATADRVVRLVDGRLAEDGRESGR